MMAAAANHNGAVAVWAVERRKAKNGGCQSQEVKEPTMEDRFPRLSTTKRCRAVNSKVEWPTLFVTHLMS